MSEGVLVDADTITWIYDKLDEHEQALKNANSRIKALEKEIKSIKGELHPQF